MKKISYVIMATSLVTINISSYAATVGQPLRRTAQRFTTFLPQRSCQLSTIVAKPISQAPRSWFSSKINNQASSSLQQSWWSKGFFGNIIKKIFPHLNHNQKHLHQEILKSINAGNDKQSIKLLNTFFKNGGKIKDFNINDLLTQASKKNPRTTSLLISKIMEQYKTSDEMIQKYTDIFTLATKKQNVLLAKETLLHMTKNIQEGPLKTISQESLKNVTKLLEATSKWIKAHSKLF